MCLWKKIQWAWRSVPRTPHNGGGLSVWLFRWWLERFTGPGKVAVFVIATLGLAQALPGMGDSGLPAVLFSLAFSVAWFRTLWRPPLEGSWTFPSAIHVGETFSVRIRIRNRGKRELCDVGGWLFWEENWLQPVGESMSVARLGPGEVAEISMPVRAVSRGPCALKGPCVYCLDPIGLMRARRRTSVPLIPAVMPLPVPLTEFSFLTQGASGIEFARLLSPSAQRSTELLGVREYRTGDSLRDVHHKVWARLGRPFTREYGKEKGVGVVLVVETGCETYWQRAGVETVLRWGAGVAEWLQRRGSLGRFFIDSTEIDLTGSSNPLDLVLDALARVPRAQWWEWPRPQAWSPGARPMGPVLAIGCARTRALTWQKAMADNGQGLVGSDGLVGKRILAVEQACNRDLGKSTDDLLWIVPLESGR